LQFLNNKKKKYCSIDFRPGSVGLFQLPQNSNVPTIHLFFRPACQWAQIHLLFKQRGAGRENDNCVGLKLAKNSNSQKMNPPASILLTASTKTIAFCVLTTLEKYKCL